MPSIAPLRPETIPPLEPAPGESEYARALELAGFIARAPLRRRRLAALVLLLGALASVAAAVLTPRVYLVDTKILAQRNLVMPSLGNPRRSVPNDSDAPTRAAADVILGRENLVAIVREADLVARWERQRPPVLRLKDRVARALTTPLSEEDKERALVSVLEKKLFVQADESTIRISLEWSHPQTAYEIVSLAERNFFAGRSAVEVAVIADTIGILSSEADHQREAVDAAFARVVQLRQEEMEQVPAAILPTPGAPTSPRLPGPANARPNPGAAGRSQGRAAPGREAPRHSGHRGAAPAEPRRARSAARPPPHDLHGSPPGGPAGRG